MPDNADTPALQVALVPVTPFQQNASIIWCARTMEAAIVDPGGDVPVLLDAVQKLGVKPAAIWLTHGHIDHAGGAAELSEKLGLPIVGPHIGDETLMKGLAEQGLKFGIVDARAVSSGRWLNEGDTVALGDLTFDVLHVPGHSPGSVVFVHPPSRFALVGDTLFAGSIGANRFSLWQSRSTDPGNPRQTAATGRRPDIPAGTRTCQHHWRGAGQQSIHTGRMSLPGKMRVQGA